MVVLGSAGALRVTLVTSAGIRGTGWGPGVSSRTIMACSVHVGVVSARIKNRRKSTKSSRPNVDAVLSFYVVGIPKFTCMYDVCVHV